MHEFLPNTKDAQHELAKKMGIDAAKIHTRVEQLHEFNPMLGFRGCRLGISYPETYCYAGTGQCSKPRPM